MTETKQLMSVDSGSGSIVAVLQAAVQNGVSAEGLEKITDLYLKLDAVRAQREYAAAMAAFQSECPIIAKTSTAKFATKSGGQAGYSYAELDEIAKTIRAACSRHGLSYSWDNAIDTAKGMLRCVCKVRHTGGHVESASFESPIEGQSLMSSAQRGAATLTYAKRQALIQALGLIAGDPDPDDHAPTPPPGAEPWINEHQVANLDALLTEVNADRKKFLEVMGVTSIKDIPASEFQKAIRMCEEKRRRGAARTGP